MAKTGQKFNDKIQSASVVLVDIEGTTTSIGFVKDTLFPYALANVESFLTSNWDSADVQGAIQALRQQAKKDAEDKVEGAVAIPEEDATQSAITGAVVDNVKWQTALDRKTGALKTLQGLVWAEAYKSGAVKGHVYDDVPTALESWVAAGRRVFVYSSGSVAAQKLLFGHSVQGDLLQHISGYFDTAVGAKQEQTSYANIVKEIDCEPADIVFLTDIIKEAQAASEAGLGAVIVDREGNGPLTDEERLLFPVITSLSDLPLPVSSKRKNCDEQDEVPPSKVAKTEIDPKNDAIVHKDVESVTKPEEKIETETKPEEKMETDAEPEKTPDAIENTPVGKENGSENIDIVVVAENTEREVKNQAVAETNDDKGTKVTEEILQTKTKEKVVEKTVSEAKMTEVESMEVDGCVEIAQPVEVVTAGVVEEVTSSIEVVETKVVESKTEVVTQVSEVQVVEIEVINSETTATGTSAEMIEEIKPVKTADAVIETDSKLKEIVCENMVTESTEVETTSDMKVSTESDAKLKEITETVSTTESTTVETDLKMESEMKPDSTLKVDGEAMTEIQLNDSKEHVAESKAEVETTDVKCTSETVVVMVESTTDKPAECKMTLVDETQMVPTVDSKTSQIDLIADKVESVIPVENNVDTIEGKTETVVSVESKAATIEDKIETVIPVESKMEAVEDKIETVVPVESKAETVEDKIETVTSAESNIETVEEKTTLVKSTESSENKENETETTANEKTRNGTESKANGDSDKENDTANNENQNGSAETNGIEEDQEIKVKKVNTAESSVAQTVDATGS